MIGTRRVKQMYCRAYQGKQKNQFFKIL